MVRDLMFVYSCSQINWYWYFFAYNKTVIINQRRVEKSAFEDRSEENSAWIFKSTTLLGIFCKISFTPAVTSCYQVHTQTPTHTYLRRCYALGASGAETSLLLTAYCSVFQPFCCSATVSKCLRCSWNPMQWPPAKFGLFRRNSLQLVEKH